MQYRQYAVHPALRHWVRYFWSYDAHTAEPINLHVHSFADRYPRLVFQDTRWAVPMMDEAGNCKPVCYISGIDTLPTDAYWESRFSHFGVSFEPHALFAIFGIDAAALTNQTPDIRLLDKTALPGLLLNASSHQQRVQLVSRYIVEKISKTKTAPLFLSLCKDWKKYLGSEKKFSQLARQQKISERQLQRRFRQQVGISARHFTAVAKFNEALELLQQASYGDLTKLAYDLNYYDQSHFIREFRQFSGLSPYAFIKKQSLGQESASFIYTDQEK